jgi:hypothetical protein
MKNPARIFSVRILPLRKPDLSGLRTQKSDLGQARDRRTLPEFQFTE